MSKTRVIIFANMRQCSDFKHPTSRTATGSMIPAHLFWKQTPEVAALITLSTGFEWWDRPTTCRLCAQQLLPRPKRTLVNAASQSEVDGKFTTPEQALGSPQPALLCNAALTSQRLITRSSARQTPASSSSSTALTLVRHLASNRRPPLVTSMC